MGTERPGLTLEDGSLVVTDNYLKVRIPAARSATNASRQADGHWDRDGGWEIVGDGSEDLARGGAASGPPDRVEPGLRPA